MSEQEMMRALQQLISRYSAAPEPRQLSMKLMARDRWRVRLLAGLTALLWLGGIACILYMIFWFNRFVVGYSPPVPADVDRWQWLGANDEFHTKMELHHSLEGCLIAVPALLLAALCTIWLVFSSRRATLNQINISLAELSEQLRQMRSPAGPPDAG
jgi:hypothetical protein